MTKDEKIADILHKGVVETIYPKTLEKRLKEGKKLRVKFGIDPTSPNIHIGRAVVLWKLRAFQDLGHQVVFIVGDFTGQIGDTSDKDAERPMLSEEQIKNNLKTYFQQAYKILDKNKTETHYNSKWLKKLGFAEIGKLANLFSMHEFSARDNIKKRLDAGKRVSLRELLYPLMQGYDSVAVKADIELGGIDQRFNLLSGRTIQEAYGQAPQEILMTVLIDGTDGRKMSSSWGNVINILDTPNDMFGKVMSSNDNLMDTYFLLAANISEAELKKINSSIKHPRDKKLLLANKITALYHGEKLASEAEQNFIQQFTKKELPQDVAEVKLTKGTYALSELLVTLKLAGSKSEARRLVEQGGVKLAGKQVKNPLEQISIGTKNNLLIQVGKRHIVKIK